MEKTEFYTVEQQDKIGQNIASLFGLKKKGDYYETGFGRKTNFGLCQMILVLANKIKDQNWEFYE
jgi:hypothetical protein